MPVMYTSSIYRMGSLYAAARDKEFAFLLAVAGVFADAVDVDVTVCTLLWILILLLSMMIMMLLLLSISVNWLLRDCWLSLLHPH